MAFIHPRTLIRDHIASQLQLAETWAENRVYPSWELPLGQEVLPAILVFDDDERQDGEYYQGKIKRALTVGVTAKVQGTNAKAVDAALDVLSLQIEPVVLADKRQGGLSENTEYLGANKARSAEGSTFFGAITLTFLVEYKIDWPTEPLNLADFLIFNAKYDLVPTDSVIDAEDTIHFNPE